MKRIFLIILLCFFMAGCYLLPSTRRQNYVDTHDLTPQVARLILDGLFSVGMTKEEVMASWGYPSRINRASRGDTWIYNDLTYIFFDNSDKVTSWSQ